jgi:hypothetical protein
MLFCYRKSRVLLDEKGRGMMKKKVFTILTAVIVCGLVAGAQGGQSAATGGATPTFSKDVAPVLYKNCTICHRPGAIAPMSLLTYKDAQPWATSIRNQVAREAMPPWHADPAHGEFLNDRRLSDAEKNTIVQWVSAGAPEGNPADLPPQPTYPEGWAIGSPDAVFSMLEDYPIPAEGAIAYPYFEIPTNLTEDKWIQAMEVRAGNPAVVHHVIVYARPPQPESEGADLFKFATDTANIPAGQTGGSALPPEQRTDPVVAPKPLGPNDRPAPRYLGSAIGAFGPGQRIRVYQEGAALLRLPAGSVLVLQMHYMAVGKETTDRTRIGFKFATERPQLEARVVGLDNFTLHIPAGASDCRVNVEMTMMQDIILWSMLPHTHLRGKRWEYQATYPDGRAETILSVPKYDFNWQTDYIFKQPLQLPKGTTIHATAWYDNSKNNPSNPDATKDVWWGYQTWDEMMLTVLVYSVAPAPTRGTR